MFENENSVQDPLRAFLEQGLKQMISKKNYAYSMLYARHRYAMVEGNKGCISPFPGQICFLSTSSVSVFP